MSKYVQTAQTDKEFLTKMCRYADTTNLQTASKWFRAFVETVVHELYYNRKCRVPDIGTFTLKYIKPSRQIHEDKDGNKIEYLIPERYRPEFIPHDTFINDVNYTGVTKQYRKRLKKNVLTKKDYMRDVRREAESMQNNMEVLSEEEIEEAKTKFQELIKQKTISGKAEPEVEDE